MMLRVSSACALLALSAAALVLGQAAGAATLRIGVPADAATADPIASSDNPSIWMELLIYDQLVRPSKDGTRLEPGLAESWTVSPDGLQYTFKLRPDARFSNGRPVTANDVAFSLRRAAGEKSGWSRFFKPITAYDIVDEHTIVMKLDSPFTPMLNNLAMFSASVLPADLVEAQGDKFFDAPVGSGPFVLKAWRRGQEQVLERNPYYWEKGKPALDGAVIEALPEDNTRVLKLKAGELDAIVDIPFNLAEQLKSDPNVSVEVAPAFRTDLVQLNTARKPFDDERVRQALNYAVDKSALVKGVLRGNATVSNSPLPVMKYHNAEVQPYAYDPAKAKALLKEAGYGEGFKTSLLVRGGDATSRQVGAYLQAALKKVGVDVALQNIEGSTQFSTTKSGNYEMSLSMSTSDTIDPDQLVGFLVVNPERANAFHTQWKNERVNALYAQERKTAEGEERGRMFQEIEALSRDGAPFILLYRQGTPFAYRKNVHGFGLMATSNYDLKDVTVK